MWQDEDGDSCDCQGIEGCERRRDKKDHMSAPPIAIIDEAEEWVQAYKRQFGEEPGFF